MTGCNCDSTSNFYGRDSNLFQTFRLAGIEFAITNVSDCSLSLVEALSSQKTAYDVHLVNAYCVSLAHSSSELRTLYSRSSVVLPDGYPVSKLGRLTNKNVYQVPGPDLFERILDLSQGTNLRHFFLGSTDETLAALKRNIEARFPDVQLGGFCSPPFADAEFFDYEKHFRMVADSRSNVVWLGLGTPKQDYIAQVFRLKFGITTICVGAAFEFLAGTKKRAPRALSKLGLEWAFRLIQEPRRLWRRYLVGNWVFIVAVLMDIWKTKQNNRDTEKI